MEARTPAQDISGDDFQRAFKAVTPLIHEEWPGLDAAALEATGGDLDEVTSLVAAHASRTRVAVKRQLLELHAIASRSSSNGAPSPPSRAASSVRIDDLVAAVRRLEALAAEEAKKVSTKLLPKAEAKVKENLWVSLLVALGLGLILGLWLNGGRRGGRNG
jgi:ElaB/YqjD/DUF883 family membrane-anchored ribosome-binding protein